ncbi:unnamed protein product [Schistosoma curassoni]|uniref:Uncharacterized protein n=1 Tax=Schistosoma curassoni TaxID=6186 RepID=A0A183KRK2_9TREM|nr:unnamed protein product [Schistosoma curassoni]
MVVGGSQQETLDPGFVLFGTRQQGVPVILRELVLLQPPSVYKYPSYVLTKYSFIWLTDCCNLFYSDNLDFENDEEEDDEDDGFVHEDGGDDVHGTT